MAYVISEPCVDVKDRSCVDACPVDCIHDGGEQLFIDPAVCVDCGACVPVCPVSAIYPADEVPTEWQPFIARNAELAGRPVPQATASNATGRLARLRTARLGR